MSGRTKRIIYYIVSSVSLLLAVAGTVLLACFGARALGENAAYAVGMLVCFVLCAVVAPLPVILHECGHALGGLLCGMHVLSLSFGAYCLDWRGKFTAKIRLKRESNGATALLPRRERGARGGLIFALFCGAALNFLYAAVMFALYFAVTKHPAMLFFALFAPLSLYEGLMALYPAELATGPTDGKFALDLIKKTSEAEVALRVMTAQGMLYEKNYGELPRALLFDAPVVREDSAAYLSLLQLQCRALLSAGEDAAVPLARLASLLGEIPTEYRGEIAADLVCGNIMRNRAEEAERYRAELNGESAAELCAQYALARTEENGQRARRVAERVRIAGERNYYLKFLDFLNK